MRRCKNCAQEARATRHWLRGIWIVWICIKNLINIWKIENCLVVWNMNFIFTYIGNNHPNWLSYFWEGVKPPTRKSWFLIWEYGNMMGLKRFYSLFFLSRQGSGRGVWTLSTAWYDVAPSMVFTNAYPGFKPKCNSRDSIVQISERYVWCNHKSGWKKQTQQSGTIQLGRAFSWWLMPNKSSTSSGYLCTKFL